MVTIPDLSRPGMLSHIRKAVNVRSLD